MEDVPSSKSVRVECERDIIQAVCEARERGASVRAVGARGSKNDCYETEGVTLELDAYRSIVAFDAETVTVQAGTTIGQLNGFLRNRGAVVPTCGEWQGATVGGSIATGSHGGSTRHGIHPCSVASLRLITADGKAVEIGRNDPRFDHVAVSMGALGIISTVTLRCVDDFYLELETRVLPFDPYLRDQFALAAAAEFFAAVWFPTARRVLTFAANVVPPRPASGPRMERFSVRTFLLDAASRYFDVNAVSERRLSHRWVDHADLILCPIPARSRRIRVLREVSRDWNAMEAALPLSRAGEVLTALDRLLDGHRHARFHAVGLRTSRADRFTLSPCHERDTIWVDLFYRSADHGFREGLHTLLEGWQSRCHWGKHIGLSEGSLCSQYPRLVEFRQLRAELDPNGTFSNTYTRRLGV